MMKNKITWEIVCCPLVLLFVYTAVSKLLNFREYKTAMHMQPFPGWLLNLSYCLPFVELVIAACIIFNTTRLIGLYAFTILMVIFTTYTALVVAHFFKTVPCNCGGVIKDMGWTAHLIFNAVFLLLAIAAIYLHKTQKNIYA